MSIMLALRPKPLPKRTYVTLTAALTSLIYDHAFELDELLAWAKTSVILDDGLRQLLTQEWHDLSDYACEGTMIIRGRPIGSALERRLTEDELRNCRYVGWISTPALTLEINPFPFTYGGGFKSRAEPGLSGFVDLFVSRAHLTAYKKVRPRFRDASSANSWKAAQQWLRHFFETQEPMPGLKDYAVAAMVDQFGVTRSRARELWTSGALEMNWPIRGRPSKDQKRKLQSLFKRGRL